MKGDVVKIEGEDGRELYASHVAATKHQTGVMNESGTQGNRKVNADQKEALDAGMKALSWKFNVPDEKTLHKEDASGALCPKTRKKLDEAGTIMNKTAKMAEQILPNIFKVATAAAQNGRDSLRKNLKELYGHIQKINEHCNGLSEPWKNSQGVRDDLYKAANSTLACNDAIDICKALISAK